MVYADDAWGHPEARLLPLAVPVVEGLRCDSCSEADHSGTFAIRLAHLGYGWPSAGRRCGEVSFSSVEPHVDGSNQAETLLMKP
jgi:hypothetical protein